MVSNLFAKTTLSKYPIEAAYKIILSSTREFQHQTPVGYGECAHFLQHLECLLMNYVQVWHPAQVCMERNS